MSNWIPELPTVNWKDVSEKSKGISTYLCNTFGQGIQSAWNFTTHVASKPEVQKAAIVSAGAAVAIGGTAAVVPALGFTIAGVKAGSIAAGVQSCIGNVAAGSLFAKFTSAGVLGTSFSTKALLGIGGGWISKSLIKPKEDE